MHSHLIPGIDDGAKNMDKSLAYLRAMQDLGFEKIITTPHISQDYYPNTPEIIKEGLQALREAMTEAGIALEVEAAAEYYADEFFVELLDSKTELLTFSGKKVLFEFSTFAAPGNAPELIFELKAKGYEPVLAHPERYVYYADNFDIFKEFKRRGCALQVNLLSLIGHYGPQQKKLAHLLISNQLTDYLGTDLHHAGHIDLLQKKVLKDKRVQKYLRDYPFKNKSL